MVYPSAAANPAPAGNPGQVVIPSAEGQPSATDSGLFGANGQSTTARPPGRPGRVGDNSRADCPSSQVVIPSADEHRSCQVVQPSATQLKEGSQHAACQVVKPSAAEPHEYRTCQVVPPSAAHLSEGGQHAASQVGMPSAAEFAYLYPKEAIGLLLEAAGAAEKDRSDKDVKELLADLAGGPTQWRTHLRGPTPVPQPGSGCCEWLAFALEVHWDALGAVEAFDLLLEDADSDEQCRALQHLARKLAAACKHGPVHDEPVPGWLSQVAR